MKTFPPPALASKSIIVAACAVRDPSKEFSSVISSLSTVLRSVYDSSSIIVVESSASPAASANFLRSCDQVQGLSIHSLGNLVDSIPNRIPRITYCRNILLQHIQTKVFHDEGVAHLLMFDYDPGPIRFLGTELLTRLKNILDESTIDGIFPYSRPYYYDLTALRAMGWLTDDPWRIFVDSCLASGATNALKDFIELQRPLPRFNYFIPVSSAFGGFGIYKFNSSLNLAYESMKTPYGFTCEHISFNSRFNNLVIDPLWSPPAPREHILRWKPGLKIRALIYDLIGLDLRLLSYS